MSTTLLGGDWRALKLITAPTLEPVSVDEAQGYCRLPLGEEDALFARWIRGAREQVERYTGRALLTQTWELVLDAFPSGAIEIPFPPLQSITSITTYTPANVSSVVLSATYQVDTWSEPGRVVLVSGSSWPTDLRTTASIVVRFAAGYGATPDTVPAPIAEAVLALVAQRARFRGDDLEGGPQGGDLPPWIAERLAPYRVLRAA